MNLQNVFFIVVVVVFFKGYSNISSTLESKANRLL